MNINDSELSVPNAVRAIKHAAAFILLLLSAAPAVNAADSVPGETRISITQAGPVADMAAAGTPTTNVFAPLVQFGYRGSTAAETSERRQIQAIGAYSPYRIYSAFTDLLVDNNHDGYYQRFRITFDADVDSGSADVYAVLYLSRNGGPWNEYYETDKISITGAAKDDAYSVVTTLSDGYPYGSYDVLIELYDAYTHEFLAEAGPYDFLALSALPLEDQYYDDAYYGSDDGGGGGAAGVWEGMLLLAMFLVSRRRYAQRAV